MNNQKVHESDSWQTNSESELTGRDLREILSLHPELNSRQVQIKVQDGHVTLEGVVETLADKRQIETLAGEMAGVKDVFNLLEVQKRTEPWKRSLAHEEDDGNFTKGLY